MAHKHPAGPAAPQVKLVLFPGEGVDTVTIQHVSGRTDTLSVTVGHIYVIGGGGEVYEMAGGPPPGQGYADKGGHYAGVTPAGHYLLDHAEHHTTSGWWASVVPWGAQLREHGGEVQYQIGEHWYTATGPRGRVTLAAMQFQHRSGQHYPFKNVDERVREIFYVGDGPAKKLNGTYDQNEFGKWSWNMMRRPHGEPRYRRTGYYLHTTPLDEAAAAAGKNIPLMQSHGCVHIHPADRDEMTKKGYLKAGVVVEVRPYGQTGPPETGRYEGPAGASLGCRGIW